MYAASRIVPDARRRRTLHPGGRERITVAMIGQKGLPATFGGIEHHVEQLGQRLVDQGVDVVVYCRESYAEDGEGIPETYQGMRLVVTPTVASKHLDAIVHSITSTWHAMRSGADVIHYHALGPGLVSPLARYGSRAKVVLTVHGLDQNRAKWSSSAQAILGLAHWMSGHVPDTVVTVSRTLTRHYEREFGIGPAYIPNGVAAPQPGPLPAHLVEEYGLEPGKYVLFVGRVVPEKRPDLILEAIDAVPAGVKVAIVGDSSFSDEYVDELRALAEGHPQVVFPGFVYGADLGAVYANAAVFVQPSDLEGLPLTLLEAISYGVPVVASDIPPHHEVLDQCRCGAHRMFPAGSPAGLADALRAVLADPAASRAASEEDTERLLAPYQWSNAAIDLAEVYRSLVGVRGRSPIGRAARRVLARRR